MLNFENKMFIALLTSISVTFPAFFVLFPDIDFFQVFPVDAVDIEEHRVHIYYVKYD